MYQQKGHLPVYIMEINKFIIPEHNQFLFIASHKTTNHKTIYIIKRPRDAVPQKMYNKNKG